MKRKLLRISAAVITGLSLTTGVAAAQTGTINQTGAGSDNDVRSTTTVNRRVENNNDLRARNNNPQSASSGDVSAYRNTTTGNVTSGSAMNDSLLRVTADIDNSGSSDGGGAMATPANNTGSVSNTGASSSNTVTFSHTYNSTMTNNNDIDVENNNTQSARSGSVRVTENTTSGSASSGNASNVSTNEIMLNVSN